MARSLSLELNAAMLEPHLRMPRYKIYVYDLLSGGDAMSDIVLENELDDLTGPRDFTSECLRCTVDESAGDYIDSGIPTSSVTFDILDSTGRFDPTNYQLTGTGDGRWLRDGNAVRIVQGDSRVDEDDWIVRFTGFLTGQAGVDSNRSTLTGTITCKALGRESISVNQVSTSDNYSSNVSCATIAADIAESDMGLLVGEYDFGSIGATVTRHKSNQFVEQSPLVSIAQALFPDLYLPRFDGEGILVASSGSVSQAAVRIYDDKKMRVTMVRPWHEAKRVNAVQVKGLSSGLVKASAPTQELATFDLTSGYFAHDERHEIYWSGDRTQLAENVYMRILQSISGGLTPLGGEEDATPIPAPNPDQEGTIGMVLEIGTGFAPYLLVLLTFDYIAASFIPDNVLAIAGITVPVGRVIQAALLVSILIVMTQIGHGSYQFIGTPFEYLYQEIRAEARETGVTLSTRNAREVTNHLVTSTTLAHALARDLLTREIAKSALRQSQRLEDLRLEVDDVFEEDSRRYLVRRITSTLGRGGDGTASYELAEVTEGVRA